MHNLKRYKDELKRLISDGLNLYDALQYQHGNKASKDAFHKNTVTRQKRFWVKMPNFILEYQMWYSEAKALVRQLFPDRLDDFIAHYEKPKARKATDS